jgi:antitoxin component YwqK of YwqJK toxin-antitoxin module
MLSRNPTFLFILLFAFTSFQAVSQALPYYEFYADSSIKSALHDHNKQGIKYTLYYQNGQIAEEGYYKYGQKHGRWINYTSSGKKISEALFIDNKREGLWTFYDISGNTAATYTYRNNNIVNFSFYEGRSSIVAEY